MHKTAYEMRISDWSSDVCSANLIGIRACPQAKPQVAHAGWHAGFDRAARAEHVGAAAVPATGAPEDITLPESERRRAGDDERIALPLSAQQIGALRLGATGDQAIGEDIGAKERTSVV